jgi:hypothetical protein
MHGRARPDGSVITGDNLFAFMTSAEVLRTPGQAMPDPGANKTRTSECASDRRAHHCFFPLRFEMGSIFVRARLHAYQNSTRFNPVYGPAPTIPVFLVAKMHCAFPTPSPGAPHPPAQYRRIPGCRPPAARVCRRAVRGGHPTTALTAHGPCF